MACKTGNPVVLTTDSIAVTTCLVSLKTVQVNNRQMTKSLFRQLPKTPLFDPESLRLTGLVWGWVNYDTERSKNRNYVVQSGPTLFTSEFRVMDFQMVWEDRYKDLYNESSMHWIPLELRKWLGAQREVPPAYPEAWNKLMETLKAVEQLFIAA